jgi:hypothetical protein
MSLTVRRLSTDSSADTAATTRPKRPRLENPALERDQQSSSNPSASTSLPDTVLPEALIQEALTAYMEKRLYTDSQSNCFVWSNPRRLVQHVVVSLLHAVPNGVMALSTVRQKLMEAPDAGVYWDTYRLRFKSTVIEGSWVYLVNNRIILVSAPRKLLRVSSDTKDQVDEIISSNLASLLNVKHAPQTIVVLWARWSSAANSLVSHVEIRRQKLLSIALVMVANDVDEDEVVFFDNEDDPTKFVYHKTVFIFAEACISSQLSMNKILGSTLLDNYLYHAKAINQTINLELVATG